MLSEAGMSEWEQKTWNFFRMSFR